MSFQHGTVCEKHSEASTEIHQLVLQTGEGQVCVRAGDPAAGTMVQQVDPPVLTSAALEWPNKSVVEALRCVALHLVLTSSSPFR